MSLVNWEGYSHEQLRDQRSELRQSEKADRREASNWSLPGETRRHASERAANCAEMIEEINAELDRRREAAAQRREESETRRQEAALREQASTADGNEVERARQAALKHASIGGRASAVQVWEVQVRWKGSDGNDYLGFFNPANNRLRAWKFVNEGTPSARKISGRWCLSA
jgi:hypothetical protein